MTDKPTNTQEKLNRLVTDVEVIKVQMTHHSEATTRIIDKLDQMAFVPIQVFEDYKDDVEKIYIPRHELKSLLKFWDFATSAVGKLLVGVLITLALLGAVGSLTDPQLVNNIKEVK